MVRSLGNPVRNLAMAEAWRLFSICFCRPEIDSFLAADVFNDLVRSMESLSSGSLETVRRLRESAIEAGRQPEKLLVEYARLFVGPHSLPAPPYGSVYLDEGKTVMGPSTAAVEKAMARAGIRIDAEAGEPADHIASELEFLHYLSLKRIGALEEGRNEEAARYQAEYESFFDRYFISWVQEFLRRVAASAESAFYCALAEALAGFLAEMSEQDPATEALPAKEQAAPEAG